MGSFRSIAYPIFGLLLAALPVLLVGASVLMTVAFLRTGTQQRRTGLTCVLATGGFLILDALLLKALPWLGLSFGPVMFSLVFLLSARAAFFVLWAGLQIRGEQTGSRRTSPLPLLGANVILTLLLGYSFYFEPFQLQTTQIEVRAPAEKLRERVRIVQLSDLHVERTTSRERALIPLVNSLHPDLIVLTGDYLNLSFLDDLTAMQDARALFGQLSAPYGVFAISGSVDGAMRMKALFSESSVVVLSDKVAQVELPGGKLAIIGVSDWDNAHDGEMVRSLAAGVPKSQYRLLLFHTPDQIQAAAQSGIDLYLAGHTHGGQVRLPVYGALVTSSVFGKMYEAGRYQVRDTVLYVSRGIGMEGGPAPRVRFLAPPEVVVIDLIPTP
jgi:predicted MPP superfamily phosphohydrolase